MPPHSAWPEDEWKLLREDALTFLREWAAQAHGLGWDALELFGVHSTAPRALLDCMGLVPLLRGSPVVAMTENHAAITGTWGSTLRFVNRKRLGERCLVWELEDRIGFLGRMLLAAGYRLCGAQAGENLIPPTHAPGGRHEAVQADGLAIR